MLRKEGGSNWVRLGSDHLLRFLFHCPKKNVGAIIVIDPAFKFFRAYTCFSLGCKRVCYRMELIWRSLKKKMLRVYHIAKNECSERLSPLLTGAGGGSHNNRLGIATCLLFQYLCPVCIDPDVLLFCTDRTKKDEAYPFLL